MKIRLADYVADFLAKKKITQVFSVVGGGAMHLNDAFGHHKDLRVLYNHHEQASAMACEAYARLSNKMAALCVTTGPGGTNALTGVVGAYVDSIPMLVLSGQVRYDTTVQYGEQFTKGHPLRSLGDQEWKIVSTVSSMTKYAVLLDDPKKIRYVLEKAFYLATNGRPGPVWIDIPVNFQGTEIETDGLPSYDPKEDAGEIPPKVSDETVREVIARIKSAKRPVLYVGYGIRLANGYESFRALLEKLRIPVVTYWNAIDLLEDDHPLYVGRAGNMGDRPGNFAVQNADLIVAVGTRLSTRQVSLSWNQWAREAKTIFVNIDPAEGLKHTLHDVTNLVADAKDFLDSMNRNLTETISADEYWLNRTANWKKKYPVVSEKQKLQSKPLNVYGAISYLSSLLPENAVTAVSNGACCVAGHQCYVIQKGARFLNNNGIASMGYGLPAAIGASLANDRKMTVCLEGDGSIMMNLQELQTIVTNRLPIKIFLINNDGYHSIRITQTNLFNKRFVGIGKDSGDLSFPSYEKITKAFGLPYAKARTLSELKKQVKKAYEQSGPCLVEIFTDTNQVWEPKSTAKRLPDGTMVSAPLEDLAPFLSREELKENMDIPLL